MKSIILALTITTALAGAVSAATFTISYQTNSSGFLNCEEDCTTDDFAAGGMDVTITYDDVQVERVDALEVGIEGYNYAFGGNATARLVTALGEQNLQGLGNGSARVETTDTDTTVFFDLFFASADTTVPNYLSAFASPASYFPDEVQFAGPANYTFAQNDINFSRGEDTNTTFRLENESGNTLFAEGPGLNLLNLSITVTEDAAVPAPIPLPATAPMLLAGLALMGWRFRKA